MLSRDSKQYFLDTVHSFAMHISKKYCPFEVNRFSPHVEVGQLFDGPSE